MEACLPVPRDTDGADGFGEILAYLASLRPRVKGEIGEESLRAALFSALFDACLERGRPLTEAEYAALMGQVCSRGCAPSIGKEREG